MANLNETIQRKLAQDQASLARQGFDFDFRYNGRGNEYIVEYRDPSTGRVSTKRLDGFSYMRDRQDIVQALGGDFGAAATYAARAAAGIGPAPVQSRPEQSPLSGRPMPQSEPPTQQPTRTPAHEVLQELERRISILQEHIPQAASDRERASLQSRLQTEQDRYAVELERLGLSAQTPPTEPPPTEPPPQAGTGVDALETIYGDEVGFTPDSIQDNLVQPGDGYLTANTDPETGQITHQTALRSGSDGLLVTAANMGYTDDNGDGVMPSAGYPPESDIFTADNPSNVTYTDSTGNTKNLFGNWQNWNTDRKRVNAETLARESSQSQGQGTETQDTKVTNRLSEVMARYENAKAKRATRMNATKSNWGKNWGTERDPQAMDIYGGLLTRLNSRLGSSTGESGLDFGSRGAGTATTGNTATGNAATVSRNLGVFSGGIGDGVVTPGGGGDYLAESAAGGSAARGNLGVFSGGIGS